MFQDSDDVTSTAGEGLSYDGVVPGSETQEDVESQASLAHSLYGKALIALVNLLVASLVGVCYLVLGVSMTLSPPAMTRVSEIAAWQRHCEALLAAGHIMEAAETLRKMLNYLDEEICANKETEEWVTDFKVTCIKELEVLGDKTLGSGKTLEAIEQYTSALSLNPFNPTNILVKRSKARASEGMWKDAMTDADEVINLDPSSHRGYETKYFALLIAENFTEANKTFNRMISVAEKSPDEANRPLRSNFGTDLRSAINHADTAIRGVLGLSPLVLIDLTTGRLCGANERVSIFKSDIAFKTLIFEITTKCLNHLQIRQPVAEFFQWVMFSHTWEGKEPTFQDVSAVDSVWNLDRSPLNKKLRQFCTTAREAGYRWAWSDTCCIDKSTSAILSQSLTCMYTWYEEAAETLVYLTDVLSSAELGDLMKSRWMTRAWTLQELLASQVIRFYTREWTLYLNDTRRNHKESPSIKQELARAIGVAPETITSFDPEDLGVREKLRLASARNATVEEDIAYSLIGIFSSDIAPRYGLGKTALGHLLEDIIARTGDVTVIAWTGKSSAYNSAFPDSLAVYSDIPHTQRPMEDDELDTCVEELRTEWAIPDVLAFYYQVIRLPRATLPCIVFPVIKIGKQDTGDTQEHLYRASTALLGKVEFKTEDTIALRRPRKLVFVHPWLLDLRDPHDEFVLDDVESESDSSSSTPSRGLGRSHSPSSSPSSSSPSSPSLRFEPPAVANHNTQALRLIARLTHPFNALLLERQGNGQYKRIASEHEIIISGVPCQTDPNDLRVRVLEIA